MESLITNRVHDYYWNQDLNCANTSLKILSELFQTPLDPQIDIATFGLNAGRLRSQCGLVEGSLLFMGIYGIKKGLEPVTIKELCEKFSSAFQEEFGSLLCSTLRPEGFSKNNPPHLCENRTKMAINFSAKFITHEMISR